MAPSIKHIEINIDNGNSIIIPGEDVVDFFESGMILWRLISFYVSAEKYDSESLTPNIYHEISISFQDENLEKFEGIIHYLNYSSTSDGKGIILFACQDFTFKLMQHIDEFEYTYKNGFGEVIHELVKSINFFNLSEIEIENIGGSIYVSDVTLLEFIKYLAYLRRWDFKISGKKVIFRPPQKPIAIFDTLEFKSMVEKVKLDHT